MSNLRTAAIVVGAVLAMSVTGLASSSAGIPQSGTTASTSSSKEPSMRATKGVVQSVDAGKLVIKRSPYGSAMSFVMNPSTERDGNIKVGSTVEVRYRTEANQRVATVVTAEHAKTTPSAPASHQ
jgi:hypothetical protein